VINYNAISSNAAWTNGGNGTGKKGDNWRLIEVTSYIQTLVSDRIPSSRRVKIAMTSSSIVA
jgi:hypothetical protein